MRIFLVLLLLFVVNSKTLFPTKRPTRFPTKFPSMSPSVPTRSPSKKPTLFPSRFPTKEFCADTCIPFNFNGVCNDIRLGGTGNYCFPGTDCTDCRGVIFPSKKPTSTPTLS